ncbi:MAG: hypothetical protein JO002_08390 [Burkholderiaceae bacterium]|nr:hypothetical protein [Burkholderiaceae bacterium]
MAFSFHVGGESIMESAARHLNYPAGNRPQTDGKGHVMQGKYNQRMNRALANIRYADNQGEV